MVLFLMSGEEQCRKLLQEGYLYFTQERTKGFDAIMKREGQGRYILLEKSIIRNQPHLKIKNYQLCLRMFKKKSITILI